MSQHILWKYPNVTNSRGSTNSKNKAARDRTATKARTGTERYRNS